MLNSQCQIIAVVGGKGGVGKSVVAANTALAIMSEIRQPCLLVDADSKSCGDQNLLLGVKPNKNAAEILSYTGNLVPQVLPQLLTSHPSGLAYFPAVRGPEERLLVNTESYLKQLEFFSRHFKYMVIDCGNELEDLQKALLLEATAIAIVATADVLVVNQTQRLIQDMLAETLPSEIFHLVLNRVGAGQLNPNAVAQGLHTPLLGLFPLDEVTATGAIQRGQPFVLSSSRSPLAMAYFDYVRKLTGGVLQRLKSVQKAPPASSKKSLGPEMTASRGGDASLDVRNMTKLRVHNELIKAMDLKKGITETNNDPAKEQALRTKTLATITQIVDRDLQGVARDERSRIIKEVLDEALGLGPLEDMLADASVTEIMVNGHSKIFVEKAGKVQLSPITFTSNLHLRNVIERIVTPLGRRIDEKVPYVDARLKDGSRVNAVIEPLAIDGPALTIRKFRKGGISPEQYLQYGSISKSMIDMLRICVENGLNLVISGGTGSGKTSLLNMISGFIPGNERIVTVEDAAELQMQQEHVVRLETRPANSEGTGAVTIRDLVRNALRMRPDRIVVGECRDGAALDMLQAMNTGHDGSMTTTHANSPRECVARLETLCMMAGLDLPARVIREQIASAVNLIVQIQRLPDGSRKVTSITEVVGMQGDTVTLQEIFRFKETGFDKNRKIVGRFQSEGRIPVFVEKMERKGVVIPREMFSNEPPATPNNQAAAKMVATTVKPIVPPGQRKTG